MIVQFRQLTNDQFGRFHFRYCAEYPDVPLYTRISDYLIARGAQQEESRIRLSKAITIWRMGKDE